MRERHPGNRSRVDVALCERQTAQAPGVRAGCSLKKKASMGLQLDDECFRMGAGFEREFARAALGKRHSRTSSKAVIVEVGDGGSDPWRNEALGGGVLCIIHRLWWRGLIEEGTEKTR